MDSPKTVFLYSSIFSASGQVGVTISGNTTIKYGVDDIEITCAPQGEFTQIISYSLHKENGTAPHQEIVTQSYFISSMSVQTTWMDTFVESRANLSGIPLPSGSATMVFRIPSDRVVCPYDIGGYVCEFGGAIPADGALTPEEVSSTLEVDVTST